MISFPHSNKKIGLAVSGGTDSAAMMHMAYHNHHHQNFIVFTVHHGLRLEADQEVLEVKKTATQYGFECVILNITDMNTKSAVQHNAREKRYDILSKAAKEYHCDIICIAHHQNDICETLLSRLTHQSGATGLATMAPYFYHQGVIFHRPILHLSRDMLNKYIQDHQLKIINDPSNHNEQYERVRHRMCLMEHPELMNKLLSLHRKATALKNDILIERDAFILKYVTLSNYGYCVIDHNAFDRCDHLTAISIMKYCIMFATGKHYIQIKERPRKNMTIGGAYIHVNKYSISVFREKRNLETLSCMAGQIRYDNRFLLTLPEAGSIIAGDNRIENAPYFARQTLPKFVTQTGNEYQFEALKSVYRPRALEKFNSDPILHHLAI